MPPNKRERKSWTYLGVIVSPAGPNASGIRWNALGDGKILKADSMQSMRELIREERKKK